MHIEEKKVNKFFGEQTVGRKKKLYLSIFKQTHLISTQKRIDCSWIWLGMAWQSKQIIHTSSISSHSPPFAHFKHSFPLLPCTLPGDVPQKLGSVLTISFSWITKKIWRFLKTGSMNFLLQMLLRNLFVYNVCIKKFLKSFVNYIPFLSE